MYDIKIPAADVYSELNTVQKQLFLPVSALFRDILNYFNYFLTILNQIDFS